jgi:hypothetical protein
MVVNDTTLHSDAEQHAGRPPLFGTRKPLRRESQKAASILN